MGVVKSLESLLLILLLIATVCKHFVDASVIQANGVPSPFLEFALHSITDLGLTNSNWKFLSGDYNGDGVVDMYCIKQQGVSSTEVHILDGASNFKSYLLHAGSDLHVSNSKDFDFALGDYNKDGKLDLWAVRKTASTTEIHILNGATSFSNFLLHTTTALHRTNENWVFDVTDFNADGKMDMVCVNMRGAIGTEVHILDGASGFKAFILHARTPIGFASSDAWAFLVSDYNGDKKPDIYGILKNGASGTTEVHVLDGAKSFNSFLVQYPTVLHPTGSEWQFQAADYDRDGKNEILCINTFHAGTSTSLHFIRAGTMGNYWSDASIWSGRIIPSESDLAIIPVGRNVILDIPGKVHSLEIGGRLIVADKVGLSLISSWVVVYDGELQIGTEDVPYMNQFLLKLTGQNRNEVYASSYGIKGDNAFLMVQGNKGKLNVHGSSRNKLSWTQLATTLNVGVNTITLKEPVNWSVGDLIVISSTDFDMNQAETFSITKISGNNRIITLDKAASYIHFGELQVYNNGVKSWTLNERAEVGLLSRNIVIEGSDVAEISNYGGHIIVKGGAFAQIEGCELRKMGQKGIVGKYPFHWHMLGPTTQQYFKSNSIHHTYNRALTIHGTVGVLVERNVAYDHLGHGFFLEDGSEYGNSLINNLGLVTKMMAENEATIPTDFTHVSTYWLTNPNNTFRGNVAGGSDFGGFWFALPKTPTGESKAQTSIKPIQTGLKEFKDNIAHSNQFSNLAFDGSPNPNSQVLDSGHYMF